MTDSAYTHIVILADRTGSMGDIADPGSGKTKASLTTTGIHDLIRDQAAQPGRITFSLVQFDAGSTDRIVSFAAADDPVMTKWHIIPRGGTPLLDAVGTEIVTTGQELAAMPEAERPGRVYFVIGSDGEENSSHEYTKDRVAGMITAQRENYGWEFIFIGADIDAFAEAGGMGIARGSTLSANSASMGAAYAVASAGISRSRAGGQSVSYTDEERKQAGGRPA